MSQAQSATTAGLYSLCSSFSLLPLVVFEAKGCEALEIYEMAIRPFLGEETRESENMQREERLILWMECLGGIFGIMYI